MPTTTGFRRLWGLGVAFGLVLSGCQVLFGDFEFKPVDGTAGAPGQLGGAAGASNNCNKVGDYRCNGAALELCDGSKWTSQLMCDTAAQCDREHLRCRLCAPGNARCTASRLERCHESGESWALVEQCVTADRCDAATGRCATCGVDEAFCSGPQLNVCNASRMGWDVTVCADANLCSTTSRSCRPCVAGEYQCNQNVLQRCNDAQEWVAADQCGSSELCQATLLSKSVLEGKNEVWSGKCNPPLCEANAFRCNPANPAQLQNCPPSRDRWDSIEPACYTAQLCDAAAGKCKDGCEPGTYRCNGSELQHCVPDGTRWEVLQVCPTAAQCSASKQTCMPCVVGEHQCNGTQLQRCSANQTWEPVAACLTPELCANSAKKNADVCDPPGCSPAGAQQCGGTNKNVLQICPKSQVAWAEKEVCATPGLCDKGLAACIPPVCDYAGEPRCTGQNHERCDANRKNWIVDAACTDGQICDVAKGCLGQCPTPAQRCNGAQIEICSVNSVTQKPVWVPGRTCPSKELCEVKAGIASCGIIGCEPGDTYRCFGQDLRYCNAGLTNWATVKTCTATQICDAAGKQCDNCVPNDYACNGAVLERCSLDGQSMEVQRSDCLSCGTSADAKAGYCYVCNRNDQQCNADQIRTCATTGTETRGTSWNAPSSCTAGYGCQVVDGHQDFCASCPIAGEARCSGPSTLQTCATNRSRWDSTACGSGGCFDAEVGNDYCASCVAREAQCIDTASLHVCSADGMTWSSPSTCASGCITVTTGDDYCASCLAGEKRCVDSTRIQACAADRRSWDALPACDHGCMQNASGNDYCAVCPPGEEACEDPSSIHTCATSGSGWVNSRACPYGCVTNPTGNDFCALCAANEVACSGPNARHSCAADGSGWGDDTPCTYGCVEVVGGDDYCAPEPTGDAGVSDAG